MDISVSRRRRRGCGRRSKLRATVPDADSAKSTQACLVAQSGSQCLSYRNRRSARVAAGLGQRGADLEAEIVHRGLVARHQYFALELTLSFLRRAGDIDRHRYLDLGMQAERHRV